MSKKYCCVHGCLKSYITSPLLSFFTIPTDPERRDEWLRLIGREDLKNQNMLYNRVCEAHFKPEDICVNTTRKLLKKNIVPSLFLPSPNKGDKETQTTAMTLGNITHSRTDRKGKKCTLAYKLFCLKLYYYSPRCYRLLQQSMCLPSRNVLNRVFVPLSTQINDVLLEALKLKVNNMSEKQRQCSLVVDEMSLKTHLYYDITNDKIIGFQEVDGVQSPSPAKRALVVVVRGIFANWSQAIGYSLLSEESDHISKWIDKILIELRRAGFKIRVIVSGLGLNLLKAAEDKGVSVDQTYIANGNQKIYYIFDASSLIKSLRNNLMKYDFHFQNGAVAKFEQIAQFYEYDQSKIFKQAYKLTDSHINPTEFEKIEVLYATQLLSRSVACGMSNSVDLKMIDESAIHTAEFLLMMNDLFDALNSSTFRHSYSHKNAFCGEQYQIDLFHSMMYLMQTLKLIDPKTGSDVTKTVDFIKGFRITIQSILSLYEDLRHEGCQYLLTRRLNQDIIESLLGNIRKQNGTAKVPTTREFIAAFRNIYFNPKEGNCAEDLTEFLAHLDDYENFEYDSPGVDDDNFQENVLSDIKRADYTDLDLRQENPFIYVCGFLFKKCFDCHSNCNLLTSFMQLVYKYKRPEKDVLVVPQDFVSYIERMEQVFRREFEKENINCKIGMAIYEQMKDLEYNPPCPCFPISYLKKLYIRMRIYFTLSTFNQTYKANRNSPNFFVQNLHSS